MPPLKSQRGFTLVELMIALALGLLIVAGVIALFLGMRGSYAFQEGLSRVQENGRFALDTMSRELRMAGYSGCIRADEVDSWIDDSDAGYAATLHGERLLSGWEANGTGLGDSYTIGTASAMSGSHGEGIATSLGGTVDAGDLVAGSDLIAFHLSEPIAIPIASTNEDDSEPSFEFVLDDDHALPDDALVIAIDEGCGNGDLWQLQNAASNILRWAEDGGTPGNDLDGGIGNQDAQSHLLHRFSVVYLVRNNPAGEPSLYKLVVDGAASPAAQELISGVESMQLVYGEDTNDDGAPEVYRSAADVADWSRIASVRVGLLLRNNAAVPTESDLRTYDVGATEITPTLPDRVRQVMTLTIGLRNLTQ